MSKALNPVPHSEIVKKEIPRIDDDIDVLAQCGAEMCQFNWAFKKIAQRRVGGGPSLVSLLQRRFNVGAHWRIRMGKSYRLFFLCR